MSFASAHFRPFGRQKAEQGLGRRNGCRDLIGTVDRAKRRPQVIKIVKVFFLLYRLVQVRLPVLNRLGTAGERDAELLGVVKESGMKRCSIVPSGTPVLPI